MGRPPWPRDAFAATVNCEVRRRCRVRDKLRYGNTGRIIEAIVRAGPKSIELNSIRTQIRCNQDEDTSRHWRCESGGIMADQDDPGAERWAIFGTGVGGGMAPRSSETGYLTCWSLTACGSWTCLMQWCVETNRREWSLSRGRTQADLLRCARRRRSTLSSSGTTRTPRWCSRLFL